MPTYPIWRGPAGGLDADDRVRIDEAIEVNANLGAVIGDVEAARGVAVEAAGTSTTQAGIALDAAGLAVVQADAAGLSAGLADQRAGDADGAAAQAEQARIEAQAAAIAAALDAGFYDSIALGRAAVADGGGFSVRPAGPDGLRRPSIFRRESASVATLMVEIVAPGEIDAEVAERSGLIRIPRAESPYLLEFIARSTTSPREYTVLGGFLKSNGSLEVVGVNAKSLSGILKASRWISTITSDDGQKVAAADRRGWWRILLDEESIEHIVERIPGLGEASGYPMVPMAGGELHRPLAYILGIHAYGQSWQALNGLNNTPQNDVRGYTLLGERFPKSVITLNDGMGFVGWGGPAPSSYIPATDFVAAEEVLPDVQTPTGAMAFRMGMEAEALGAPQVILARTEARGNTQIEELMPLGMTDAIGDGGPFHAWEQSVIAAHTIAQSKGTRHVVRFIPWTQGANDAEETYGEYAPKLTRLLNYAQQRAMEITEQDILPEFLIVQHPSSVTRGYSPTHKVVVDFCKSRSDATLVTAGYGYSMGDVVHWDRWGCTEVGELEAIAARMRLMGLPWDSPMLDSPVIDNEEITFDIIGAHDVRADTSIVSDRHQINGTYDPLTGAYEGGIPVPFHGFEGSIGSFLTNIAQVTVERRKIRVVLEAAPMSGDPLQIRYAMHNNMVNTSARGDGRSANRGTIRADWTPPSMLRPTRTLRRWLASDYYDFNI